MTCGYGGSKRIRVASTDVVYAVGVNSEGHREILGLDLATTEDGAASSPSSVPGRPWTLWSAAGDLRRPHRPRRHHRDHYGRCFVATMPNPLPGQPIDQGAEKLRVDGRHHGAHHIRPTRPGSGVGPAPPCRRPNPREVKATQDSLADSRQSTVVPGSRDPIDIGEIGRSQLPRPCHGIAPNLLGSGGPRDDRGNDRLGDEPGDGEVQHRVVALRTEAPQFFHDLGVRVVEEPVRSMEHGQTGSFSGGARSGGICRSAFRRMLPGRVFGPLPCQIQPVWKAADPAPNTRGTNSTSSPSGANCPT